MQDRILLPATGRALIGTLILMTEKGKPGRRKGTPADYQDVIKLRLTKARGDRSHDEMGELLTERMGRKIVGDTYRQWESKWNLPLDAIMPVCDITHTSIYEFLGRITEQEREEIKKTREPAATRKIRLVKPELSGS